MAFERDEVFVTSIMNGLEDVLVVQFTRAWLLASWIVGHVKMTNPVDVLLDIADDVAFADLLVVDVETHLHIFAVHRLETGSSLRD